MTNEFTSGIASEGKGGLRIVPSDISDASIRAQRGEPVNIRPLFPLRKGETVEGSFQDDIQKTFDWIVRTVSSSEHTLFTEKIGSILANVRNQDFLFDLEGTLTGDDEDFRCHSGIPKRVYHINPWMKVVVESLMRNGNRVGFWTSATDEGAREMRKVMNPGMASLPLVTRDGFEKVVKAYQMHKVLSDRQILEIIQSVYPSASMENFEAGKGILTDDVLKREFDGDPEYFLRQNKFPQLFISSRNGFFVDDNKLFLDSATDTGWPENKAIQCDINPGRENSIQVAERIASVSALLGGGESPKPKTAEQTLSEKRRLKELYEDAREHYEAGRMRYKFPAELNENFVLVYSYRPGYIQRDAPTGYLQYLSNFGAIEINMWVTDSNKKIIVVSEGMYTLGTDEKNRGKGKSGMEAIHRILQSLSDATGYTVFDIATPNQKSAHLLQESEGYHFFDAAQEKQISQGLDEIGRHKFEMLMKQAKPFDSKIKEYHPQQTSLSLSERENLEIDRILDLIMIDRQKPVQK